MLKTLCLVSLFAHCLNGIQAMSKLGKLFNHPVLACCRLMCILSAALSQSSYGEQCLLVLLEAPEKDLMTILSCEGKKNLHIPLRAHYLASVLRSCLCYQSDFCGYRNSSTGIDY